MVHIHKYVYIYMSLSWKIRRGFKLQLHEDELFEDNASALSFVLSVWNCSVYSDPLWANEM